VFNITADQAAIFREKSSDPVMIDRTEHPIKKPSSLQLTVPAQDSIENPNVETDQAKLIEWINNLPQANPTAMAAALYKSIYQINRFPGKINQRHTLIDCYQSPFKIIYQVARKASQKQASQTTLKQTDITSIAIKTTIELAYSYKIIINEHLQLNNIDKYKQQFSYAIYSALKLTTLELMLEYSNLIPDSKKAWREIFQLYALAEQYDLVEIPIEEDASIGLLFKRILLIAIIDPYRLPRGEVWLCYHYLSHWAIKAELHTATIAPNDITGLFLVDLQAMYPPKPPEQNTELNPKRHRLLHVNSLNLVIHQQRKQLLENGGTPPNGVSHLTKEQANQMFRHMLLAWHVRPTRRSERHEKYGYHAVTYGLSAINHYLKKGSFTQENDTSFNDLVDDTALTLEESTSFHRENKHYTVSSWRIFNQSIGGIGIVVPPPFPKDVQVGQLIMIELETDAGIKQFKTGVIRRMIERDANTLEVGVQFLPGKIAPISIRPCFYDKEIKADFQHGILMDRGSKAQKALITPSNMYKCQREFVLENNAFIQHIVSDSIIETTPIFDCFDYHEITKK